MNCAKHTDQAATAFCRTCGKAMCPECKREVQGTIYCEDCLAARMANPSAANGGAYPPPPPPMGEPASPGLAAMLGFIPGVGAMYNGQFAKGFVHVIVFAMLIWLSDNTNGLFGLGIAAWLFYMVFDAYTTAKARKYGLPIPDPLGINRMVSQHEPQMMREMSNAGEKVGSGVEQAAQEMRARWNEWQTRGTGQAANGTTTGAAPGAGAPASGTTSGFTAAPPPPGAANPYGYAPPRVDYAQQQAAYAQQQAAYYAQQRERHDRGPVGAIVLIALGCLFLLDNMNVLQFRWAHHLWPVILIAIGVALFIRRQRPDAQ